MAIPITIFLSFISLAYILYPLYAKKDNVEHKWNKISDNILELNDHKLSIFSTLKDLELDLAMNKISKEDFDIAWEKYKKNAISIIKKIDTAKSVNSKK